MACDWPVSARNGSTATLHGRELPTELPVQTLCTALAETALSYYRRVPSPRPYRPKRLLRALVFTTQARRLPFVGLPCLLNDVGVNRVRLIWS